MIQRHETSQSQSEAAAARLGEAERSLEELMSHLTASMGSTMLKMRAAAELVNPPSKSSIAFLAQRLLDESARLSPLYDSLMSLSASSPVLESPPAIDVERLGALTARLECEAAQHAIDRSVGTTLPTSITDDEASLSLVELQQLLSNEAAETAKAEVDFQQALQSHDKRVMRRLERRLDTAREAYNLEAINRATTGLSELSRLLEGELAVLLPVHHSLSASVEALDELEVLSSALLRVVQEPVTSPPVSVQTHDVSPHLDLPDEDALLHCLSRSLRKAITSRAEVEESTELAEDRFADRLADEHARITKDSIAHSLARAHLYLYSPTRILHSTPPSVGILLEQAKAMEREAKKALSSETSAMVDLGRAENDRLGRLRRLLEQVRDEQVSRRVNEMQ